MKFLKAILLALVIPLTQGFGNIRNINIQKITQDTGLLNAYEQVMDYLPYYEDWNSEWKFHQSKKEIEVFLEKKYNRFNQLKNKNAETHMLLGTIAAYLYNLDAANAAERSDEQYKAAIQKDSSDYRGYWFLGKHFAMSARFKQGYEMFNKAQQHLPSTPSREFWNDYAMMYYLVGMPAHALTAVHKAEQLSPQTPGKFEIFQKTSLEEHLQSPDPNGQYAEDEIWSYDQKDSTRIISHALGMKFTLDQPWEVKLLGPYNKQFSVLVMVPRGVLFNGEEILPTLLVNCYLSTDESATKNHLDAIANSTSGRFKQLNKTPGIFPGEKVYRLDDPDTNPACGGEVLYAICFEKDAPENPGIKLENPSFINGSGIYRMQQKYTRFKGKIHYMILLESCQGIFEESYKRMINLLQKQVIIE